MSLLEQFDVMDSEMNIIGKAARKDVHEQGLWHQTFHCWIYKKMDDRVHLLFQLRHESKDTFPSLLDISCAGHLLQGETVEDGVRELEEELGIQAVLSELISCGIIKEENALEGGGYDREHCHVFGYECDQPLEDYRVQLDEVSGLFWVEVTALVSLLNHESDSITGRGFVVDELTGKRTELIRAFQYTDFVPHELSYYEQVFRMMEE